MIPLRGLSRRGKAIAVLAAVTVAALVGVGVAHPMGSTGTRVEVRTAAVQRATGAVKGLFVAAGRVEGSRSAALAGTASSPLSGWITPVAVPTADGGQLLYSTWQELRPQDPELSWSKQGIHPGDALGRPTLWVHDFGTGQDEIADANSFSAAVRSDGTIAYVRGTAEYRAFRRYAGDLVVRNPCRLGRSSGARSRRSTSPPHGPETRSWHTGSTRVSSWTSSRSTNRESSEF